MLQIEGARRHTVQQVGQASSGIQSTDAILKLDEEQVKAQIIAYESVRGELKAGLRTTIEVLNAEQELQSARQVVVQATGDSYLARTALLAAVGALSPEILSLGLEPYSQQRAFQSVRNKQIPAVVGIVQYINKIGAPGFELRKRVHLILWARHGTILKRPRRPFCSSRLIRVE